MARNIARYSVTTGLSGCYMPDSVSGPYEFTTRRDLAAHIRWTLEFMEWPATAIRQIPLRRIWSYIARHGSSCAHFSIQRQGYEIAFHGLTADEFAEMERDSEY